MLRVNCWLNQPSLLNRRRTDDDFERRVSTLRAAARQQVDASVIAQVKELKQTALARTSQLSRQQEASFFFLAGHLYTQANQKSMAHQYYGLCERRLKPDENAPLLVLHMAWAPISDALHMPLYTLHSYSTIVRLLQTRQTRKSTELNAPWLQHYQAELVQCRASIIEHGISDAPSSQRSVSFDLPLSLG